MLHTLGSWWVLINCFVHNAPLFQSHPPQAREAKWARHWRRKGTREESRNVVIGWKAPERAAMLHMTSTDSDELMLIMARSATSSTAPTRAIYATRGIRPAFCVHPVLTQLKLAGFCGLSKTEPDCSFVDSPNRRSIPVELTSNYWGGV